MIRCSTVLFSADLHEVQVVKQRVGRLPGIYRCGPPESSKSTMDRLTAEHRSWNMSRIKGRDTGPEKRVRSLLHQLGFRFSLRRKELPGRPDIVLPGRAVAVFVHGCFWHRHEKCRNSVLPKTRPEFWLAKLGRNVERDRLNAAALKRLGWQVLTIWECELEDKPKLTGKLRRAIGKEPRG